jgi:hypothetical protein
MKASKANYNLVDHTNRVHAFIQSIVDIKKKHGTVTSK